MLVSDHKVKFNDIFFAKDLSDKRILRSELSLEDTFCCSSLNRAVNCYDICMKIWCLLHNRFKQKSKSLLPLTFRINNGHQRKMLKLSGLITTVLELLGVVCVQI